MTDVALATPADEDPLWEMLLGLHEENGIFKVCEEKVRASIREATEQRGGLIGLIRAEDGTIEASMCLVIDQFWYTEDYCLLEHWLYVVPEARTKRHSSRLIDWAKYVSNQLGLKLQAGIMSTDRTAAKEKMYQRKMTPVGGIFMWDPTTGKIETGVPH